MTCKTTAGTISPPITDHLPTYTIFHTKTNRKQNNPKPTLSIKQYNKNKHNIIPQIQKTITQTINNSHQFTTTNRHFKNIQQAIQTIIEKHEKKPKPRRKPWCNPKIKQLIKKQHKLHKQRIKNPTQTNIQKHNKLNKELKETIKKIKREHITKAIASTKNDPKKQAKILDSIMTLKSNTRTSPTTLTYENKTYTNPKDIANALNDHYITIARKTNETIPHYADQNEQKKTQQTQPTHLSHSHKQHKNKSQKQ
jgi:hypothetical protein